MEDQMNVERWKEEVRRATAEYIQIDDALKQAAKDTMPLRKRKKELSSLILEKLVGAKVDACNITGTNDRLVVKKGLKKTQVRPAEVKTRLIEWFGEDEEQAERCVSVVLTPEVTETVSLRRVKQRKKSEDEDSNDPGEEGPDRGSEEEAAEEEGEEEDD
eukprot:jgi/Mesvir1/3320/Mv05609-RA.1